MAKPNSTKKAKDTGTMDVANTNNTTNTGSRPIIITNRPMVADPMVIKGKKPIDKKSTAEKASGSAPEMTPETNKLANSPRKGMVLSPDAKAEEVPKTGEVISPEKDKNASTSTDSSEAAARKVAIEEAEVAVDALVNKDESTQSDNTTTKPIKTDTKTSSEQTQEKPEPEASEPEADTDTEETTSSVQDENPDSDSGIVDELAKQAASKKQQQAEDKVDIAQREKTDELIAAKTYFVPTTQVAKRRVKYVLISVILLAILGIVGLNFAADAELIDVGINPLTNLL